MSHARLIFIGVTMATLLATGCAGPAWIIKGKTAATSQSKSISTEDEMSDAADDSARSRRTGSTSSDREPSLSQVLDDLERLKHRSPSDFAVIQSAVEDTSTLFPPQYQQTYRDQMLGMALRQQEPFAEPAAPQASQYPTASRSSPPTSQLESPATRVPRHVSSPATVLPAARADNGPTHSLRSTSTAAITTHVSDLPSSEPHSSSPPTTADHGKTASVEATPNEASAPGPWSHEIEQALASLSADLARPNLDRDERMRLEVLRRLLYVVTNRRDEAVSPIEQLDEDEREFWKHQIHGLLVSIDADAKHPTTRRAALALRDYRTATDYLANISTLDVSNLTFCNEVLSYGEYRVFDSYSFRAKDEVVLYVEVDNFAAHPRGDSFETELHGSYEIVDDAGRRVASVVLPVDKQVSNNRRRDYFIAYLITMPSQIAPGAYRLRLTVEDVIGKKSNHAAIDFRIQ